MCMCQLVHAVGLHSATFLRVVHPIEHYLRGPPVTSSDVARHDLGRRTSQAEVQDLDFTIFTHTDVAWFQILETWE